MRIDEELQKELRESFNPDGSELRMNQLRILDILKFVDKICRENNIRYWISSGTLLGAVRHSGFIPWDDDVDIEMLRDDYIRFNYILPQYLPEYYKLQNHATDKNYFLPFAKVRDERYPIKEVLDFDRRYKYHGVFIDVFCLEKGNMILSIISKMLHQKLCVSRACYGATPAIYLQIIYFLLTHTLYPVFRWISNLFSSTKLFHTYGTGFHKCRYEEDLFPLIELQFEGVSFYAPHNYDHYLEKIYGDYLCLPKVKNSHF